MSEPQSIRIWPGAWRPHHAWEHIVWISPPWGSEDYLWLDFPEAIFSDQGLLYLSHINHRFPGKFQNLPPAPWSRSNSRLHYQRVLPNGVEFSGSVEVASPQLVELSLTLYNGSPDPLTSIRLQTCLFMRAYYHLSSYTLENKFLHTGAGWIDLKAAKSVQTEEGYYRFGWRDGPQIADLPVIVCRSSDAGRVVAFSWLEDTYSLISNPSHPCIHADPAVPDLGPGERYTLMGEIYFPDNGLDEITARYTQGETT